MSTPYLRLYDGDQRPEDADLVLVPVPFDGTCSYGTGAADGPAAIAEASHQVDWYDLATGLADRPSVSMLAVPEELRRRSDEVRALADQVRSGELGAEALGAALSLIDAHCAFVNDHVLAEATRWRRAGKLVGVVGGDHGSIFGAIAAAAALHPGMGILHIDAHADLRDAWQGMTWSHASIMHNVIARLPGVSRLVQVGIRDFCAEEVAAIHGSHGRIVTFFDEPMALARMNGEGWDAQVQAILAQLPDEVYLSFDIDGLDPTLCPHTGTPVPGGLSWHQLTYLLSALGRSGKRLVGFDLNEVAPGPEGDEWDANVGARVLFRIAALALSQRARLG